eukprot:357744-Chlamydomonas_euryale.AAC.7
MGTVQRPRRASPKRDAGANGCSREGGVACSKSLTRSCQARAAAACVVSATRVLRARPPRGGLREDGATAGRGNGSSSAIAGAATPRLCKASSALRHVPARSKGLGRASEGAVCWPTTQRTLQNRDACTCGQRVAALPPASCPAQRSTANARTRAVILPQSSRHSRRVQGRICRARRRGDARGPTRIKASMCRLLVCTQLSSTHCCVCLLLSAATRSRPGSLST